MSDAWTIDGGLGAALEAAFPDAPAPTLDHTVLPRDDHGRWQPAHLDMFDRPIVTKENPT